MTTPLPTIMRAAILTATGGPEVLQIRDDAPVPDLALDGVLIQVEACGVNNTDINTRVGWYSKSVSAGTDGTQVAEGVEDGGWGGTTVVFPRIQGADPSGTVVAAGADADQDLVGQRVLVDPWIRDRQHPERRELAGYLGSEFDGGFAQYCAVPARNVYPHNSELSAVQLASLPCSWSTAEHMLARVQLAAGQSIAVTGASGGVGTALISLAKLRGADVVAIAGPTKLDAVLQLGADAAVSRSQQDSSEAAVVTAALEKNGGQFDAVADVVGGDAFPHWLGSLKRGGQYVTAGAIAGPNVDLDLRTLYLNDLQLHGATIYEPQVFSALMDRVRDNKIAPVVARTYPLERIADAQAAFLKKEHVGAIVITLG